MNILSKYPFRLPSGSDSASLRNVMQAADDMSEDLKPEPWVGIEEIARHLAVSVDSVRRWMRERGLPGHKAGGIWRFKVSEVDAWVRSGPSTESAKRGLQG